jgi:D-serine deaminase-like pyridoxal phosphate-dependent protein
MKRSMIEKTLIGKPVDALPTPAIVADVDLLDANLSLLAGYFAERHCNIRPHFKSHKCVSLARRQMAVGGACGITCAKVSEAEQLVYGGITDVLIANQIIGRDKVQRAAILGRQAILRVVVDSREGITQLADAARDLDVTIGVLVEVDIGMNRCGVPPGQPVVDLAERIEQSESLRFDGLQGYEGHIVTLEDFDERKRLVCEAMEGLVKTRRLLESDGLPVSIISAGGTGTYDITGNIEGVDEVQCGSYALMDVLYKQVRPEFHNARYVLATVISAGQGKIVADVGLKGIGNEYASPVIAGHPEARVLYVAEEHLVVENLTLSTGAHIRIIPPHGCTTNNLYEYMWVTASNIIEDVWPVEGRGCLQ